MSRTSLLRYLSFSRRTTITEQCACLTTDSETLPISARFGHRVDRCSPRVFTRLQVPTIRTIVDVKQEELAKERAAGTSGSPA